MAKDHFRNLKTKDKMIALRKNKALIIKKDFTLTAADRKKLSI